MLTIPNSVAHGLYVDYPEPGIYINSIPGCENVPLNVASCVLRAPGHNSFPTPGYSQLPLDRLGFSSPRCYRPPHIRSVGSRSSLNTHPYFRRHSTSSAPRQLTRHGFTNTAQPRSPTFNHTAHNHDPYPPHPPHPCPPWHAPPLHNPPAPLLSPHIPVPPARNQRPLQPHSNARCRHYTRYERHHLPRKAPASHRHKRVPFSVPAPLYALPHSHFTSGVGMPVGFGCAHVGG